jgi:uncharacterized membrane protein YhaH (DUF805 family)
MLYIGRSTIFLLLFLVLVTGEVQQSQQRLPRHGPPTPKERLIATIIFSILLIVVILIYSCCCITCACGAGTTDKCAIAWVVLVIAAVAIHAIYVY